MITLPPSLSKVQREDPAMFAFLFALANLAIMESVGSPEDVVEARATRLCMDTTGSTGNILYIKKFDDVLGDRTKGWVLV
jgi:hypothetical protein